MPSNKTRNTLARQWELLKLLPTHGSGKSAAEITEALAEAGFDVSKRQVERDLLDLQEVFGLECNDASIPYGWRWGSAPVELSGLTLAEALSLQIVEETLKPLLPASVLKAIQPRLVQAKTKLAALTEKSKTAKWAEKVCSVTPTMPMIPAHVDGDILETVQLALLDDEQVAATYTPFSGEEKHYKLHPLGLGIRGAVTYLVATVEADPKIRLFALHRFQSAERTYEASVRPKGFELTKYVAGGGLHFGSGAPLKLHARINDVLAKRLTETPISEKQKITPIDGGFELRAQVVKSWQLSWWILSKGSEIEILQPKELRDEIRTTLQSALAQYVEG